MKTNHKTFDTVRGVVDTIRSYNPKTGFVIARLLLAEDRTLINLSGTFPGLRVGEWLTAQGIWVQHAQNDWHLELKTYSLEIPKGGPDLEIYLSNLFDTITPELAERIVHNCGRDTFTVIESAPERLQHITGLSRNKIRALQANWREIKRKNELRSLLQHPSIKPEFAVRLYDALTSKQKLPPKQVILLAQELYALDLDIADPLARLLDLPTDSPVRVQAGVRRTLKQWNAGGHVYAERAAFLKQCAELLQVGETPIKRALKRLVKNGELIAEADRLYPRSLHDAEVNVAARLSQHQSGKSAHTVFRDNDWSKSFNWLAAHSRLALTPLQQQAVKMALTNQVSILTGGPGTGKTTTVRAVVELAQKKGCTIQLAAPTGRAAKRLAQATGAPAQTLHRLLAFKPVTVNKKKQQQSDQETFARTLDRPLAADFLVVDESSMLDLALTNDLVSSISPRTHLLFVGDPHQLPSIGSGRVLQDLIESQALPVTALDTIFRQRRESSILANAHRIREGKPPIFIEGADDFFIIEEQRPDKAAARVVDLVTNKIPVNFGLDSLEDIQVLSPAHQGPAGVNALNQALQSVLNPPDPRKAEIRYRDRILREGDRILQTRNNYAKGVFNGDHGRINAIDHAARCLVVEFDQDRIEYGVQEWDELTHAYALTVHKAQGSEYRAVVLVLPAHYRKMLERNLLYTAVTRARELVVLVAAQSTISAAIKNNRIVQRHTHLAQRLRRSPTKTSSARRKPESKQKKAVKKTEGKVEARSKVHARIKMRRGTQEPGSHRKSRAVKKRRTK